MDTSEKIFERWSSSIAAFGLILIVSAKFLRTVNPQLSISAIALVKFATPETYVLYDTPAIARDRRWASHTLKAEIFDKPAQYHARSKISRPSCYLLKYKFERWLRGIITLCRDVPTFGSELMKPLSRSSGATIKLTSHYCVTLE